MRPEPTKRCGRCGIVDVLDEFFDGEQITARCRSCRRRTIAATPAQPPRWRFTDEQILDGLIDFFLAHRRWPYFLEWMKKRPEGAPGPGAAQRRYGSWSGAVEAAERELRDRERSAVFA